MIKKLNFKYIVKGNHPIFRYVNRRCLSFREANNVKIGLEAIGYKVEITAIADEETI